ncbi:uncharacterized protein si:ch211-14c7.2 [Melanotaenia boesemani]|uniref:uncharacterized protein si:ch211-14c7.2 n=1 Tax=Melanotaenia boesemani TaxID=1250792 RepID=UPI001C043788|nr:uncharacterized protein si:ch211-14c7.2 [Melanotaenia boesemani]
MRPTTSTMLQQNNNNNYPCLNMSGSTREMLQRCSRASLPFPSRLELGLGDLPLVRGLRAWALCSKNRRRANGLMGGGHAPTAPPAGRGNTTSCPRPADVCLSGEWGRMGYGLPLGLDARQAGIGALVTVATLKTSEGSGKTQTQCLFLRTEKGSCLYSTAKPSSGVTTSAASSMVGEWLRGKTVGGGGRDTPTGRRDGGSAPPAQTGANQVRVQSGRRWRKSGNAAGRGMQQRSREDPELAVEERQEEQDKGGQDRKQFPSPQRDSRRAKCCHNISPKTCAQCGRRPQRTESLDQGESPGRGVQNRLKRERQKNEEEEEEKGGHCYPDLAVPSTDLEHYRNSHSCVDDEEMRGAKRNEGQRKQTSHSQDDITDRDEDADTGVMKKHGSNDDFVVTGDFELTQNSRAKGKKAKDDDCEEVTPYINGLSNHLEANEESEKETEYISSSCAASVSRTSESSVPVEGSVCNVDHETSSVQTSHESKQIYLEVQHLGPKGLEEADFGLMDEEKLDVSRFQPQEPNLLADESSSVTELNNEEPRVFFTSNENNSQKEVLSSPLIQKIPCISESDGGIVKQEDGDFWRRESTCNKLGDGESEASDKDHFTEGTRNCASGSEWRLQSQESADGWNKEDGDASGQTAISIGVYNVACADPPTSVALSNPAPSLPPLASMATGLPCLEAEKEKEEVVRTTTEDSRGQEEERRYSRELEEQGEEERGSNVATEDVRKEEEEEEDEFGVFMQAEGESAWSEGVNMSASVPCGSTESVALGNQTTTCRSGWAVHQSDDSWTAFPRDVSDAGGDVEQWWPARAAEARRDGLSTNHNLASLFAEAFPSFSDSSSSDSCDLDAVPTLTQLLRGRAGRDQGLLDSFHDLNKMIVQRYKKANSVSRGLLLKTLHLEQPHVESRPASWTSTRRLSPGLPSANQHAQNAAAKRRLSYDYNRNIME